MTSSVVEVVSPEISRDFVSVARPPGSVIDAIGGNGQACEKAAEILEIDYEPYSFWLSFRFLIYRSVRYDDLFTLFRLPASASRQLLWMAEPSHYTRTVSCPLPSFLNSNQCP